MNKFGHIDTIHQEIDFEYTYDDNEYYVQIDNLKLIGTSVFPIANGFLTIVTEHENLPTWLRIYDKKGIEKFHKKFSKTINISISENKKFAAFFTGDNCIVLDLTEAAYEEYQGNSVFAVDNEGYPVVYLEDRQRLSYRAEEYRIEQLPRKILFLDETPVIFTEKEMYIINHENLVSIRTFSSVFFEAKVYGGILYFVEKEKMTDRILFRLFSSEDLNFFPLLESREFDLLSSRTHTPIPAPLIYDQFNYPYNIGNSYGEFQLYGWSPYMHPGVDFLGEDYQEVFAVHSGYVKAFLTTGGDAYWRLAIADEDTSGSTEGYLYAHLNQSSVVVGVGDSVNTGDFLGTLYPWSVADFTHIHFARLEDSGITWNGDWWTIDNPLVDVFNLIDTTPPVFENTLDDQLFAFRDQSGNYLESQLLTGQFDIISKCHDICNSNWKIDVWDMEYSLQPASDPDSTIFQQFSYAFDMPLDTYINSNFDFMVLNTIYSRDETCYSNGNYEERDYYHIVTNSNGDSVFTSDDALQLFDSSQFPDGDYIFRITARDANLNTASADMQVTFFNGVGWCDDEVLCSSISLEPNYPNPFNPVTQFEYSLSCETYIKLKIFNLKGQLLDLLVDSIQSPGTYQVSWNAGKNPSGLYLYKIETSLGEKSRKMILIK